MKMRLARTAVWTILGLGFLACGGGGSSKGGSYANIAASLAAPSGTVDETTAADVAEEFETADAASGVSPFGRRDVIAPASSAANISVDCPVSGTISVTASGNENSSTSRARYNNCCVEAGCCFGGTANAYATVGDAQEDINICIEASLSGTCEGQSINADYSGCIGSDGLTVLVEVNGETFAVTGNYSDGNGTLEITGSNGSFTCTYSGGSGSCTGTGGNFSF
jgi:hypothetical protein